MTMPSNTFPLRLAQRWEPVGCSCVTLAFLVVTAALRSWSADTFGSTSPAQVKVVVKESEFNTITLTPQAEQRLGIKTSAVERRQVERTRAYGGELTLALNPATVTSDALPGLEAQSVLSVLPMMTPAERLRVAEAQIDADGQAAAAQVLVEAARIAYDRAERLWRDKAGSQRAVDEARAQLQSAQTTLTKARAHRELLGPALLPRSNPARLWVRVPVYAGDLKSINLSKPAYGSALAARPGDPSRRMNPVDAPPSANPASASVDLYYEVDNADQRLRMGERVSVAIPLQGPVDSLVIPWSSVLIDIYGGTWVYAKTSAQTYVRRRVRVSRVADGDAILADGPEAGATIVTEGAAELFGTEVGFSK